MTTDNDFFRMDQEQWYGEFAEYELPETFDYTMPHPENFEFDDVPF